ncbi:MAG TPA: hypothetical protein PKA28_17270 [Methylomusa anaerophila]|uniref:50S ribosomal protein L14e n=1 Tax=Methylomusa anaerophila TaxID=1930071 RepID=A0A348AJY4_9FIRM|nr:hypothetical protein [Methylomusa anaerophila]BBB91382.1 hypothetical protein MAMMFC1_02066 [Methylomusa anaerophila]HML90194.1 hypothetical protein [Methylomusa anaerophila]
MSAGNIVVGELVISSAGRDQGHLYVVIGRHKERDLLLADGRGRSIGNPKKKNVKHIKKFNSAIADRVAERIATGQKVTDEDIRQALALMYKPDNL